MKKFIFAAFSLLAILSACTNKPQFHIEGHINGAQDSTLYLEALTVDQGVLVVDSVQLDKEGSFSFAYADTTSCPELYRLRIADQVINLSVDSTETITVEAQWPGMAFNYSVKGSPNCETIRQLSLRGADLERRILAMGDNRNYTMADRDSLIQQMIKEYKDTVKIQYIQNHYDQASSYYAIFQMIGNMSIFDAENDESDVRWVNAVANAWNERYPGTLRTESLVNTAMRGRKNTRHITINLDPNDEKVKETGIIDMGFNDINGHERRLSDLKGQVVLLDFTAYSAENSQERIMAMRELYNEYHKRGFEIYQVSLDPNIHYWKTVTENLPWICVYDDEGVESDMLTLYQVQQINTYFLIDRSNTLVDRMENIPDLKKAIEALL